MFCSSFLLTYFERWATLLFAAKTKTDCQEEGDPQNGSIKLYLNGRNRLL